MRPHTILQWWKVRVRLSHGIEWCANVSFGNEGWLQLFQLGPVIRLPSDSHHRTPPSSAKRFDPRFEMASIVVSDGHTTRSGASGCAPVFIALKISPWTSTVSIPIDEHAYSIRAGRCAAGRPASAAVRWRCRARKP